MAPIDYIPRTREMYASYLPYRWVANEDAPWTPLGSPVAESKVALLSTGGIHLKDQAPFHYKDDTSCYEIPKDVDYARLRVSHFGYLTHDAGIDPNCVFPLERLREMEADGAIGELADPAYSLMGGIYSARRVRNEVVPMVVEQMLQHKVEVLFLVPA